MKKPQFRKCPKCGCSPELLCLYDKMAIKCPICDMRTTIGYDYKAVKHRWNSRYGLIKGKLEKKDKIRE